MTWLDELRQALEKAVAEDRGLTQFEIARFKLTFEQLPPDEQLKIESIMEHYREWRDDSPA